MADLTSKINRSNAKDSVNKRRPADGADTILPPQKGELKNPAQFTASNFSRPEFLPKVNNDNEKPDLEKTRGRQTNNQPPNPNVPSRQRGGREVIPNPAAVSEETAKTISRGFAEMLDQSRKKAPEDQEDLRIFQDLSQDENFPEDEVEELEIPQDNLIPYIQEVEDEESDEVEKISITPPYLMYLLTIVEWILSLAVMLIALFFMLTGALLPVGVIIAEFVYVWKAIFNIFIFVWTIMYETKHIGRITSSRRSKTEVGFGTKKKLVRTLGRRGAILVLGILPIIDVLIPTDFWMVHSAYRSVKKELESN